MVNVIATLVFLTIAWTTLKIGQWQRAYNSARLTKFPVFWSPVHINDFWWMVLYPLLVPIFELLPRRWTTPWLLTAQIWKIWHLGYTPFQEAGSDTFMLATPQGSVLWTCDPALCHQFETQRFKSQVPVDSIKFFEVYGPTIGTVEGNEWKTYRRVVTSAFNSTTHAAVWTESVRQTTSLIDHWSKQGSVVPVVKYWTTRLALHVISSVFFSKNLEWRDQTSGYEPPPPGHLISFEQALFTVVSRLGVLSITPRALMGILPIPRVRKANLAFTDWALYMEEMRQETSARIEEVASKKNKSILESIVLAGTPGPHQKEGSILSDQSVLGNIFFTMMAGHETVGNAIAFTLYLLAIYPEYQSRIQEDLDGLLQKRPWEQWSIEQEYQALQNSWTGAVLKEVLRPYAVVPFITRTIVASMTVADSNGDNHFIPAKTLVSLDYAAAFRNPKTWPRRTEVSSERRARLHDCPALDFDPSRWLKNVDDSRNVELTVEEEGEVEEEGGISTGTTASSAPLVFPFGQGARTCPGRLFAQVEMTSVLATILKDYTLQLVVDERVQQDCGGDQQVAWEKTRDDAMKTLFHKIQTNITIELEAELPVRLVARHK